MTGFIKYNRSEAAENLHCNPNANHLLNVIAYRASRNGNPVKGLGIGESFIGDYKVLGLTEQKYRTAKKNLEKWGYITCRVTNRGTIAKLMNTKVYDINQHDITDRQRTDNGQTTDRQRTDNDYQECKNVRKEEGNSEPPTLSEINSVENPDTRINKFLPFGLIDAKETLQNIYTTTEQKQTRIRELTGEDWTEQQAEDVFKSFYEIGITNYYNNLRNVDKLKAAFDNWITREAQFKKANKHEQQDETLEAHFKKYFSESKFSKLERNKVLQRMTIFYNENLFKFRNIAKSFENKTITPQLIYELSHQALGRNLVGSSEDKKLKSFKKFLSTLTDYQRAKSDIREQLESFNRKTDRN